MKSSIVNHQLLQERTDSEVRQPLACEAQRTNFKRGNRTSDSRPTHDDNAKKKEKEKKKKRKKQKKKKKKKRKRKEPIDRFARSKNRWSSSRVIANLISKTKRKEKKKTSDRSLGARKTDAHRRARSPNWISKTKRKEKKQDRSSIVRPATKKRETVGGESQRRGKKKKAHTCTKKE